MKRIVLILTAVLIAALTAGCSIDSLEGYRKAAEKTEAIKMGQASGEFTVAMDFNTEGLTEEQIKALNYIKDVKGSFNAVYDHDEYKAINRNYLNLGGLGFDFDLYVNKDDMFMKLPIIGKYVRMDELIEAQKEVGKESRLISEEAQTAINGKWLGLLKREDIFKGKDIILTTPDGEVKTTQYTITLNDEQIKSLASDCAEILSGDEKLKESYESLIKKNVKPLKEVSFEKFMADLKENIKSYRVESFSYNAYVDIDGYIVNETVELVLKMDDSKDTGMKGLSYRMETRNWDINKEQSFEFPVLNEDNTMKLDNVDQDLPFMFEGMINKED